MCLHVKKWVFSSCLTFTRPGNDPSWRLKFNIDSVSKGVIFTQNVRNDRRAKTSINTLKSPVNAFIYGIYLKETVMIRDDQKMLSRSKDTCTSPRLIPKHLTQPIAPSCHRNPNITYPSHPSDLLRPDGLNSWSVSTIHRGWRVWPLQSWTYWPEALLVTDHPKRPILGHTVCLRKQEGRRRHRGPISKQAKWGTIITISPFQDDFNQFKLMLLGFWKQNVCVKRWVDVWTLWSLGGVD